MLFIYVKSSFHSLNVYIFLLTFWLYRKNGWIRKLWPISKFMTSQTGQPLQYIYHPISQEIEANRQ